MVLKNTSGCSAIFSGGYLAQLIWFCVLCPFDILDYEPLKVVLHPPDDG
jgi:hypothetical protein